MFAKLFELRNKKLKDNKKKGFTLVELIVVLVILAILAALLIPALTGYIDKAKRKSIVAETCQVVLAAQTLADEAYGKTEIGSNGSISFGDGTDGTIKKDDVKKLAEVDGTIGTITIGTKGDQTGIITVVEYTNNGKKCTYKTDWEGAPTTDGNYNVAD